jgi:hypothetical protein
MQAVKVSAVPSSGASASEGGIVGGPLGAGSGDALALGALVGSVEGAPLTDGVAGAPVATGAPLAVLLGLAVGAAVGTGGVAPHAATSAAQAARENSAPRERVMGPRITLRSFARDGRTPAYQPD